MKQRERRVLLDIGIILGEILTFSVISIIMISKQNIEKKEFIAVYKKHSQLITIDNKRKAQNLKINKSVIYVQPNYHYQLCCLSNKNQWALKNNGTFQKGDFHAITDIDMNIPKAWDIYRDKEKEIIIAVIDTGIDYKHNDLKSVMWKNINEIEDDGIDNDNNGYNDDIYGWNFFNENNNIMDGERENNHGTHIAGIIAASQSKKGILGVASNLNVKIMSIKVLGGKEGIGTTYSIVKGIQYAEKMGASICNLSISIKEEDNYLKQVISESKMLFVVAAGNGDKNQVGINLDKSPKYPAAYSFENLVTVGNIQPDGRLHKSSNYGLTKVDIAAPGVYIYSTITNNHYTYMHGTSMAAPMVTGVVAMISSYYEKATNKQIKEILLDTVKQIKKLNGKIKTAGIPDAYQALVAKKYQYLR